MPTLAEIGKRIGIPAEALEDLIELPIVADAIRVAGEQPHWAPDSIWKGVGRPTLYTESNGLNLDALYLELTKRRELTTRATDGAVIRDRLSGPLSTGLLMKAENVARRRLDVIDRAYDLLTNRPHEPGVLTEVRALLGAELEKGELP